jgi:thioredoxin:protein disulfide reductase
MIAANFPDSRPESLIFCRFAAIVFGRQYRDYARVRLMRPVLLALFLLGFAGFASAKPWWLRGVESNESDFLPPDVAFRVAADVDGNLVRVRWVIADGYYLYRQKIEIKAESPDLVVATPALPRGVPKTDPFLGTQEIYRQQLQATAAFTRYDGGAHPLQIKVTYQGCADAGLCYPPITKVLFPEHASASMAPAQHPWEGVAIVGGGFAFLLAGLMLRKGRTLDLPAA